MTAKTRLELTWIGKENRPRVEPRILIEDERLSHHAATRREGDLFDNVLIHGDNLLALRALEQDFTGKVKCVFIDPPYNTGSAFEHYDDGLEHSIWLSMMRDRLEIIRRLMSEDGSLWVSLDDNEAHYFKVMCDQVFGRSNFISNVIWQKKYAPANDAIWLSNSHDHILVYAKNSSIWRPRPLPRTAASDALYKNPDNDPRGAWLSDNYTCNKSADERPNLYYSVTNPNTGEEIWPKRTAVWRYSRERHAENVRENLVWWGANGSNSTPRFKRILPVDKGRVAQTIWPYDEVGHTQEAKREQLALHPDNPFSTPKPERLIERILQIATQPGELVLDSFAGSGTTGAVAHKLRRSWIMVELGDHAETHIAPRLNKVIDAEDPGGVTQTADWKGGGGYRFYRLAPSLMEKDSFGQWVISKDYDPTRLAEAMCKHLGFAYQPSDEHYWMHGRSSEADFLYVTTNSLTHDQLKAISEEVGPDRSLLICCRAFQGAHAADFTNLTITKIPSAILDRCEWGRDDYSLKIAALPMAEDDPATDAEPARRKGSTPANQPGLFGSEDAE